MSQWYYLTAKGEPIGPVHEGIIRSMVALGDLAPDAYVWDGTPVEQGGEWIRASAADLTPIKIPQEAEKAFAQVRQLNQLEMRLQRKQKQLETAKDDVDVQLENILITLEDENIPIKYKDEIESILEEAGFFEDYKSMTLAALKTAHDQVMRVKAIARLQKQRGSNSDVDIQKGIEAKEVLDAITQDTNNAVFSESLILTDRPRALRNDSPYNLFRFLSLLSNITFLSSPLVFGWGINRSALWVALYVVIALTAMQFYFKPGSNFLTDMLWAVVLAVGGGTLFSVPFGLFIFGMCAGSPIYNGLKNPIEASMLVRVYGGPLFLMTLAIEFAAYFYTAYQSFLGGY